MIGIPKILQRTAAFVGVLERIHKMYGVSITLGLKQGIVSRFGTIHYSHYIVSARNIFDKQWPQAALPARGRSLEINDLDEEGSIYPEGDTL